EFAECAFRAVGIEIEWKGEGVDTVGINKANGKTVVKVNKKFYRPAEVELLLGSPKKAEEKLGWKRDISFDELVSRMAKNDLAIVKAENNL
ncbi:MAG TPA: GDP-mannose 4,6-dehydratase, partial [Ruminococcus sp.]|nr:GDP-mannose 4,6-dehydratase [Ruminococcus sp.]